MGNEAQRGLQLLPSKTNPRQKRWQRPGGAQGAPSGKTGGDTRATFVARHQARRAAEKQRLEAVAKMVPHQRDFEGNEVTPAQIAAAKKRLKAIAKEEGSEKRRASQKQAVVNKRAEKKQTGIFDTPEERKHGKTKQRSMFSDEEIDEAQRLREERKKGKKAPKQEQASLFGDSPKKKPAQGGLFKSLTGYEGPLLLVPTSG